jgi:hypothetical protein
VREGSCAGVLVLGMLLAGCKGGAFELGEPTGGLGQDGEGSSRPLEQRCLDGAASRVLDPECWPTRHVGRWHGFATGAAQYLHVLPSPFVYPSGELLLEVDDRGSASLTFSGGNAGAPNAEAPCSATGALDSCPATPGLVLGFGYELVGLRMTGGPSEDRRQDPSMDFALIIAEPWSARCDAVAADAWPCTCNVEGCGVSLESLQATLVLSADGRALRGAARSVQGEQAVSAGWEFVRE